MSKKLTGENSSGILLFQLQVLCLVVIFQNYPSKANSESASYNIMKEVMKYRKIDAHEHVGLGGITRGSDKFC